MRTVHPFALLQCSAVQPFSTDTNCKHKTKDQQPSAIAPPILVTAPSNLQIHQPQVDITIYNITYQPIRVSKQDNENEKAIIDKIINNNTYHL